MTELINEKPVLMILASIVFLAGIVSLITITIMFYRNKEIEDPELDITEEAYINLVNPDKMLNHDKYDMEILEFNKEKWKKWHKNIDKAYQIANKYWNRRTYNTKYAPEFIISLKN